jgi:ribosomal protein S27AE
MNLLKISCLFLVLLCGCVKLSQKTAQNAHLLPPNAQNVEYLNDKWGKFELNGQLYYFSQVDTHAWTYFPVSKKEGVKETTKKEPIRFKCPNCGAGVVITDLGPVHEVK